MRKLTSFLLLMVLSICCTYAQQAKYVFYFIGDGMGVNQVQGTEIYQAELKGQMGISPLLFTRFPYSTVATTHSATHRVTDSAAAGTALATGQKTKNSTIGMLKDRETPISSIGVWAKNSGHRVGITTSVTVNHATPAAFYAHAANRNLYHLIGKDLYTTGFDFYAGSDFRDATDKKNPSAESLYDMAGRHGYTIARGYKDYLKKSKKADKMILLQPEEASKRELGAIPYAIDRLKGDMTLQDITRSAINFLYKDASKGFFLMVEGGRIDWACHSNDAATTFHEIIDFDDAIKIAYEFYSQHPDETLIVVTADHETGGFVLGTGTYDLNLQVLKNQKVSENGFTRIVNGLRAKTGNRVTWEAIRQALKENFGFWDEVELTAAQEARLKSVYEKSLMHQDLKMEQSEYAQDEPIAAEAKRIINEIALVGWVSGGHSAGYVPVFAIGAGAELFQGRMDNTEIPKRIAQAAGYEVAE